MEISEKIRKLLALSGNNPNAHEAQAAAEKARALMMEHHLSMGDIAPDQEIDVVDKALSADATAIPLWMIHLGMNIADAFRCSTYTETLRRGRQIIGYAHRIVGLAEDVDAALAVMAYCRPAAYRLLTDWVAQDRSRRQPAVKTGWLMGFAHGIQEAFKEQERQHPEWGLVLAKHPAVQDKMAAMGLGKPKKRQLNATWQGYQDGRQDGYAVGKHNRATARRQDAIEG